MCIKTWPRLKYTYDRYGCKLAYILARDEEAAAKLLDEALQGAFYEIKEYVVVLKPEELLELRRALKLEGIRRLLEWLEVVKPIE